MLAKRIFDVLLSCFLLVVMGWLIVVFWIGAAIDTGSSGLFIQDRVGRFGRLFSILKLRSIAEKHGKPRISSYGKFIRKAKIDEMPQLINVLIGDMSFVGPRPDIEGYYDRLVGVDRMVLRLRPGLTSEAAIKYLNEEELLAAQPDPLRFNDEVLFPDKVRMNLEYFNKRSFFGDIWILLRTALAFLKIRS